MAIIEFHSGPLTHQKLMKWSKDRLASELLSMLDFLDAKEKKRQQYEDALRPFAEAFEVSKWHYDHKNIPVEIKGVPPDKIKDKWFSFLDSNQISPEIDTGAFRKAWEAVNGKRL